MILTSFAFEDNGVIPSKYTCDGEDASPPLSLEEVPVGTESFVLIMEDPDVPSSIRSDGMWDHWLVWNIPPDTREIPEETKPRGIIGKNTGGRQAYGGPCPPDREHRYFFRVYALNTMLHLDPETTTKHDLITAMEGHVIEIAELMGKYARGV